MIKEKVLIADDEKDIVSLLGYHLHKAGVEVIPAYSGAEALEKAGTGSPDLIVLDIMMPEPDGFEVCRILRHQGYAPLKNVPIVMLTAKTEVEDKIKGLSTGADDYVTKPFELKELMIDNFVFLSTSPLSVILKKDAINYKMHIPFLNNCQSHIHNNLL